MAGLAGVGEIRPTRPPARQSLGEVQQVLGPSDLGLEHVGGDLSRQIGEPGWRMRVGGVTPPEVIVLPSKQAPSAERPRTGTRRDLPHRRQLAGVPRAQEVARHIERERVPAVPLAVVQNELITPLERFVEAGEGSARWAAQLLVGVAHEPEGVVVEAEPECSPCSSIRLPAAALRPLAPLPPRRQPSWYTVTSKRSRSSGVAVSSKAAVIPPAPPPSTATLVRSTLPAPLASIVAILPRREASPRHSDGRCGGAYAGWWMSSAESSRGPHRATSRSSGAATSAGTPATSPDSPTSSRRTSSTKTRPSGRVSGSTGGPKR